MNNTRASHLAERGGTSGSLSHSSAKLSRRQFLRHATWAGFGLVLTRPRLCAAPAEGPLPTRVLGRTQARVSILGLGTAPIGEARIDPKEAERIFGEVMDCGVNYIDTARNYGHAEGCWAGWCPAGATTCFW
jgi:hypothetical protein